jgi:hypothetical protein
LLSQLSATPTALAYLELLPRAATISPTLDHISCHDTVLGSGKRGNTRLRQRPVSSAPLAERRSSAPMPHRRPVNRFPTASSPRSNRVIQSELRSAARLPYSLTKRSVGRPAGNMAIRRTSGRRALPAAATELRHLRSPRLCKVPSRAPINRTVIFRGLTISILTIVLRGLVISIHCQGEP